MSNDIVLVSSGYDMTIRFWSSLTTGAKSDYSIKYMDFAINAMEMPPKKDKVVIGAGNSLKFFDFYKPSTPTLSINSHEGLLISILFPKNLDNIVISGGEDCSVRINDIRVGKAVKTFMHSNYVNSLAIGNNNNDIIAADENGTIKIWDIQKGEMRNEYNSNMEEEGFAFRSISLAEKDGFLIGAKSNGNLYVFDYNINQGNFSEPKIINAHNKYITKCLLSPENNMLATCGADSKLKLWERKKLVDEDGNIQTNNFGKPLLSTDFELNTVFIGHKMWVWDCDFTVDSQFLVSCSSDKTIKTWNILKKKLFSTLTNEKGINNIILCD